MACLSGFEMRAVGFEPAAFWSVARRSIQLSYARTKRVMGIEPTYPAWKAGVLPLNYTRKHSVRVPRTGIEPVTRGFSVLCSTN